MACLEATTDIASYSTEVQGLIQQLAESNAALESLKGLQSSTGTPAISPIMLLQVQKSLLHSIDLLEKILSSMKVGIAYLDTGYNYIWVNPAFARQRGCAPETLMALNHFQEYPNAEHEARFRRAVEGRECITVQGEARTTSDYPPATRYFDCSVQPVIHGEAVIGLIYTEHEVTDRVLLERSNRQLSGAGGQGPGATEAERRAEELNAVIGAMSEAVTIFDRNGQPRQVNEATRTAYGFDPVTTPHPEAIERLTIRQLNGEPVETDQLPSKRALRGEPVRQERLIFRNALGIDQIIIASANPIYQNGELIGAVTVWTDVTEREHLLREIKSERSRLSTLIANAPVGLVAVDRSGELLLANTMSAEMMAHDARTVQGYNLSDGATLSLVELARSAINGKAQVNREIVIYEPDGERRFLLVNSAPIVNQREEIDGAVAIFQDITAQKEAQQSLRETEERFAVALKNSPITVYTTDRELRYTWIYHQQYGGDNLIGRRDDEISGAGDMEAIMSFKRQVLESGVGERREIAMELSGVTYIYDVTAEPLRDEQGEITGLTVAAVDITEQKRSKDEIARNLAQIEVQRRLIQQRELERQQIARDLHDGPLQDLIGINYGLREALEIPTRRERLSKVDVIQASLQGLIQDMRQFCSELRPPALAPFGLEKAIRSHLDTFQMKYPSLQIHARLQVDQDHVPEDGRMALYRIYQELMNNIVKHSNATSVQVRFSFDQDTAELEVTDNGVGFSVPNDWVETARQGHLGLVGILERTEAVGGVIRISSYPGHGTNVVIQVPLTASAHNYMGLSSLQ